MNIRKLTTMAMLTAISMIVFLIEAQIPLPIAIPGVKLGIANVITLFAIWTLGRREAGAILMVRIVLGNLIIGNVMGMLYSLAGIVAQGAEDAHHPDLLPAHVGLEQAHDEPAQHPALAFYAPVLLLAGIVTGFFTGQCTQAVLNHLDKLKHTAESSTSPKD